MPIVDQLERNVPGASLIDFRVGGTVAYVFRRDDPSERRAVRQWAEQAGLPVVETSGQVLVAPAGFSGLLILSAAPAGRSELWSVDRQSALTPAALISQAGLAGRSIGDMIVPVDAPGRIVNRGAGSVDHAIQLLSLVKQQVRDILHIQLRENLTYLGF